MEKELAVSRRPKHVQKVLKIKVMGMAWEYVSGVGASFLIIFSGLFGPTLIKQMFLSLPYFTVFFVYLYSRYTALAADMFRN